MGWDPASYFPLAGSSPIRPRDWGAIEETVRLEEEDKDPLCLFLPVFQYRFFSPQQQFIPFSCHTSRMMRSTQGHQDQLDHTLFSEVWISDLQGALTSFLVTKTPNLFLLFLLLSLWEHLPSPQKVLWHSTILVSECKGQSRAEVPKLLCTL